MFKRNTIFQGADFRNFRKSRFLDFWQLYPIQFFARIFIVATRNWFDEANDGLWPNYIFYKNFDVLFFWFVWCAKNMGKYSKTVPKTQIYRGFLLKVGSADGAKPLVLWSGWGGGGILRFSPKMPNPSGPGIVLHSSISYTSGNFVIKPGTRNQVQLTGNRLEPEPAWTGTGVKTDMGNSKASQ